MSQKWVENEYWVSFDTRLWTGKFFHLVFVNISYFSQFSHLSREFEIQSRILAINEKCEKSPTLLGWDFYLKCTKLVVIDRKDLICMHATLNSNTLATRLIALEKSDFLSHEQLRKRLTITILIQNRKKSRMRFLICFWLSINFL